MLFSFFFFLLSLKFSTRITWCFPRIQAILSGLNRGFLSRNPAMFYVEFLSFCPSFPRHSLPVTARVNLCGVVPWVSLCHVHRHFLFCVGDIGFWGNVWQHQMLETSYWRLMGGGQGSAEHPTTHRTAAVTTEDRLVQMFMVPCWETPPEVKAGSH